jgi:hypothetical protein
MVFLEEFACEIEHVKALHAGAKENRDELRIAEAARAEPHQPLPRAFMLREFVDGECGQGARGAGSCA